MIVAADRIVRPPHPLSDRLSPCEPAVVSPGAAWLRRVLLVAASVAAPVLARDVPAGPQGWRVEADSPAARVVWTGGTVDIDTPAGLTLWHSQTLTAPVAIEFDAMMVARGGANDAVSDLNAFWMAHEPDGTPPRPRTGRFEDYDTLRTYYVGIGGNRNRTTRLRRYVGRAGDRPLLPQHDRADPAALLIANRWTRIRLVADGTRIAVWRDDRRLFAMHDRHAYTRGWFGLRTTQSHVRVRHVRVTRP